MELLAIAVIIVIIVLLVRRKQKKPSDPTPGSKGHGAEKTKKKVSVRGDLKPEDKGHIILPTNAVETIYQYQAPDVGWICSRCEGENNSTEARCCICGKPREDE